MRSYPIVPGRGLVTRASTQMRLDFLRDKNLIFDAIANASLDVSQIQNNIESYIGSVEIPVGFVGPILFKNHHHSELVYCAAGTLEGSIGFSFNLIYLRYV